jgi:hypothetical protein
MRLGESGDYNQQVGMTLAEIAYSAPGNIPAQLAYRYYATQGEWVMTWLGETSGNQMYVGKNRYVDQWVVSVRGSLSDPLTEAFWINWLEQDLNTLHQVELPFGGDHPGALISWGTLLGLEDLLSMRDKSTGKTLLEYVRDSVPQQEQALVVLGHSLGGCLASVLAAYLYEMWLRPKNAPASCIVPLSFAAPTAGNQELATYLEKVFDGYPFRYENSLDIAPKCWSLTGLMWIMQTYKPRPIISDFFYLLLDADWWLLYGGGYHYQQPGAGEKTEGTLQNFYWWFEEAGYQHSGETYLQMYGAPPVKFPLPKSPVTGMLPRSVHPALPSENGKI